MAFLTSFFVVHFMLLRIHLTAKVSEGTNRNMCARNTLVQLLATYTNPESECTASQTDRQQDDANSRSYCVAVQSAKNVLTDDDP